MTKIPVSIIGFGRFGQLFAQLLSEHCDVLVTSRTEKHAEAQAVGSQWVTLEEALKSPTIIYSVPISELEPTITSHLPLFGTKKKCIIDVLSVKCHARDVLTKHLPKDWNILLTHPMFGPDSVRIHGVQGLPIVMDGTHCSTEIFHLWKDIFTHIGLVIKEMTCEEHDKYAAESQGVTHFIGRTLDEFGLKPTPIDTLGAEKLSEVTDQVRHDTWQLFLDLQRYNPYTKDVRKHLRSSFEKTYDAILPQKTAEETVVIGIQGGVGSFNEEAVTTLCRKKGMHNVRIVPLYTTENVLEALKEGEIDIAQFAIYNLLGGIVEESLFALAGFGHRFEMLEKFKHPITYHLMTQKGVKKEDIKTIVAHPIALEQCRETLMKKYEIVEKKSGTGDFLDIGRWAEEVPKGTLDTRIALLGPGKLTELYELDSVDNHLEDQSENFTYFLWIKR